MARLSIIGTSRSFSKAVAELSLRAARIWWSSTWTAAAIQTNERYVPQNVTARRLHRFQQGTNTLTLLGVAADLGHVEIGQLMLSRGACPRGDPPALLVALCNNQPQFVDLLLKRGTGAVVSDQDKKHCMRLAALEGDRDKATRRALMEALVGNGLSVDMRVDCSLNTVLHRAVKYRVDSLELLMDLGADVNAQNRHGATPLILACRGNNLEAAQIILSSGKADLCRTTHEGSSALHEAVNAGCGALMKLLILYGSPVNRAREDGMTPLDVALEIVQEHGTDYLDLVALLIQHGATLKHWTPHKLFARCCEAVMEGIEDLVELYLKNGCDPNDHSVSSNWVSTSQSYYVCLRRMRA